VQPGDRIVITTGYQSIIDKLIKTAIEEPQRFPNLSNLFGIKVKLESNISKKLWEKINKEGSL
jgi:hypothetical protein